MKELKEFLCVTRRCPSYIIMREFCLQKPVQLISSICKVVDLHEKRVENKTNEIRAKLSILSACSLQINWKAKEIQNLTLVTKTIK